MASLLLKSTDPVRFYFFLSLGILIFSLTACNNKKASEKEVKVQAVPLRDTVRDSTEQPFGGRVSWKKIPNANVYRVQVSIDNNFEEKFLLFDQTTKDTAIMISIFDIMPKAYYWRYQPGSFEKSNMKVIKWGAWNVNQFFLRPSTPVGLSPHVPPVDAQGYPQAEWVSCFDGGSFTWRPSQNATKYQVQFSKNSDMSSPFQDFIVDQTRAEIDLASLDNASPADRDYFYWRVRAGNNSYWSNWSIIANPPGFGTLPLYEGIEVIAPDEVSVPILYPAIIRWNVKRAQTIRFLIGPSPNLEYAPAQEYGLDDPSVNYDWATGAGSIHITGLTSGTKYYYMVIASNNCPGDVRSEVRDFIYYCPATTSPTLSSPADNAINIGTPATLVWFPSGGAQLYEVETDDDAAFGSPIRMQFTNSYAVLTGLDVGKTYFWRVRASNDCQWSSWSAVSRFTTCAPLISVTLASPANNGYATSNGTITWNAATNATQYTLQVDDQSDFSSPLITTTLVTNSYNYTGLAQGSVLYWRVRANNGCSWGNYSTGFKFTVCADPGVLTLISPSDVESLCLLPKFDWSDMANVISYTIQADDDPLFGTPIVNRTNLIPSEYQVGSSFGWLSTTTYYWRVRGFNGCSFSPWSSVQTFRTPYLRPVVTSPIDNATNVTEPVTVRWNYDNCDVNSYGESINYTLEVYLTPVVYGDLPVFSETTSGQFLTITTPLLRGRKYDAQVTATVVSNCAFSTTTFNFQCQTTHVYSYNSYFTMACPILPAPTLTSPTDGTAGIGSIVLLDWGPLSGSSKYQLEIDDNSDFNSPIISQERWDSDYATTALVQGTVYYWRTRGFDDCVWGNWSSTWQFTP